MAGLPELGNLKGPIKDCKGPSSFTEESIRSLSSNLFVNSDFDLNQRNESKWTAAIGLPILNSTDRIPISIFYPFELASLSRCDIDVT